MEKRPETDLTRPPDAPGERAESEFRRRADSGDLEEGRPPDGAEGPELQVGDAPHSGIEPPPDGLEGTAEQEAVLETQSDFPPSGQLDETAASPSETAVERENRAGEALRSVEGLNPESWRQLDSDGRFSAVADAEQRLCAIDGRDSPKLERYDGPDGDCGYYDPESHTLHISNWSLEQDHPREAVNTVAHEDRHAYQEEAMKNPEAHGNTAEVESWRENSQSYIRPEVDYEGYRNQPIERDAWEYGDRVSTRLYGGDHR